MDLTESLNVPAQRALHSHRYDFILKLEPPWSVVIGNVCPPGAKVIATGYVHDTGFLVPATSVGATSEKHQLTIGQAPSNHMSTRGGLAITTTPTYQVFLPS